MLQRDCESSVYQERRLYCSWLFLLALVAESCFLIFSCWSHLFFPPRICARITHSYLPPHYFNYLTFLHSFPVLPFRCLFTLFYAFSHNTQTHISGDLTKEVLNILSCYLKRRGPFGSCLKSPYHDKPCMSSSNAAIAWEWLWGFSPWGFSQEFPVQISPTATAPALTS